MKKARIIDYFKVDKENLYTSVLQCSHKELFKRGVLMFLALSFAAGLLAFSVDMFILKKSLIAEGSPQFGAYYLIQLCLTIICSLFIVLAMSHTRLSKLNKLQLTDRMSSWGTLSLHIDDPVKRHIFSIPVKNVIAWAILLLSIIFLLIFIAEPKLFSWLSRESGPIENLSALFLFYACGVFLYNSILLRKYYSKEKIFLIISLGFTFCFFLIAMEEISWFQHFLSYKTPRALSGNLQNELNFHNFATNYIENIYYFGAFLFLILIPFIKDNTSFFKKYHFMSLFIPSRFIIFASTMLIAFNYDMWNILFIQIAFFVTLFILIFYIWYLEKRLYFFILLFVYILTQVIFIIYGDNFMRNWEVTEYKEFFIALGFLIYSIEVLKKSIRIKT